MAIILIMQVYTKVHVFRENISKLFVGYRICYEHECSIEIISSSIDNTSITLGRRLHYGFVRETRKNSTRQSSWIQLYTSQDRSLCTQQRHNHAQG